MKKIMIKIFIVAVLTALLIGCGSPSTVTPALEDSVSVDTVSVDTSVVDSIVVVKF